MLALLPTEFTAVNIAFLVLLAGQQQLVQYQMLQGTAQESGSRRSLEKKELSDQILAAALPKNPLSIPMKPPGWANKTGDLLNHHKCCHNGMKGPPSVYHLADTVPPLLYRLPSQTDQRPHIHAGLCMNKWNGPTFTDFICRLLP